MYYANESVPTKEYLKIVEFIIKDLWNRLIQISVFFEQIGRSLQDFCRTWANHFLPENLNFGNLRIVAALGSLFLSGLLSEIG